MSDQMAPPIDPAAVAVPPAMPPLAALMESLGQAASTAASKSKGAQDARDAKDYAQAALFLSQALVTVDPTRINTGDSPEAVKASQPSLPSVSDADHDGKIGEK